MTEELSQGKSCHSPSFRGYGQSNFVAFLIKFDKPFIRGYWMEDLLNFLLSQLSRKRTFVAEFS